MLELSTTAAHQSCTDSCQSAAANPLANVPCGPPEAVAASGATLAELLWQQDATTGATTHSRLWVDIIGGRGVGL